MRSIVLGIVRSGSRRVLLNLCAALCLILVIAPPGALRTLGAEQPAVDSASRVNPLIARLEEGGIADGEVWTFIDMEHSPYIIGEIQDRIEAVAAQRSADGRLQRAPVVRLPMYGRESPAWAALQVLDLGALGVVFQSIETAAQAERAISSMRFPPQRGSEHPYPRGFRSGAPRGGATLDMTAEELLRRADVWPLNPDGELMAIIMIETAEGVRNVDNILTVPGIGAILIGGYDLSLSLGVGPPRSGPAPYPAEVEAAIQTVARACAAHGVVCGIAAGGGETYRRTLIDQGFRLFLN